MSHLTRAAPGGLWRRPRRSRPAAPGPERAPHSPPCRAPGDGAEHGPGHGGAERAGTRRAGWPGCTGGHSHEGTGRERGARSTRRLEAAHGGPPPGPATLHPPPGSPRGPARRRQVPGKAPAPHGGIPPAPHRETSSTFSPAGARPGTDRPPPAPAPLTHGVHRSLNSLATVSMPPARATAM